MTVKITPKVAITGSEGLFGWHLRCFFKTLPQVEVIAIDRAAFSDDLKLSRRLSNVDAVIHLAGMNHGDEETLYETNLALTTKLITTLSALGKPPHVLFANSTHSTRNTAYGRSKKECAKLFQNWAEQNGALFSDVVFPHLFGEHGKPFYNSVISTFCHQIAVKEKPSLHQDSEIEPLHLSEASQLLWKLITEKHSGPYRAEGKKILVSELLEMISEMDVLYRERVLPKLSNAFEEQIFNTYKSYLFPAQQPLLMELKSDARGSLFESVKTLSEGQCFLSTTHPGFTRGNHFHIKKFERFCVVKGQATIRLRRLFSNEVVSFQVSGDKPSAIDIPTLYTHNITNTGSEELITLFWSGEIFDPKQPDTYPELVETVEKNTKKKQDVVLHEQIS